MLAKRFDAPPLFAFPNVEPGYFDDLDDDNDGDDGEEDVNRDSNDDSSENNRADLFDAREFFAVEQDLLLVKHRCFQPELKMDEVSQRLEREFGVSRSVHELEARFRTLQSPQLSVLFALYLQAISLNKDAAYAAGAFAMLPEYQSQLRSTRTSCETKLFQLIYEDDKLQNESSEMISVEVAGRNFPKYTRSVSKAQLCRLSSALQHLIKSQQTGERVSRHQAFTLHAAHTRHEKLQLTDAVAFYDSCHVYNHMEQPIFDRFVQFAKDPSLMERLELLRQQLEESTRMKHDANLQLRDIFETQHRERTAALGELRDAEFARARARLEKVLEDDIQHIRRMHEKLLSHERAKIDARFEEQVALLSENIEEMRHETVALRRSCETNGWQNLERDIKQAALQVERVFGASDYLVRLLILAEDLDAEPLRRALISYLSEDDRFPQFALRREMTSKMIPDTTVLEILKRCPTKDLREIEVSGNRFLHHELVAREIHTRRVAFSRLLSSLPNDKLRAALQCASNRQFSAKCSSRDQEHEGAGFDDNVALDSEFACQIAAAADFPELLSQELARRRDFSCVKMNSERLETQVNFSDEDCLLQLEVSHRYCTVLATKERKQGESGRWMFEVTIEVFSGDGESILLGWEVPRNSSSNIRAADAPAASLSNARASLCQVGVSSSSLTATAVAHMSTGSSEATATCSATANASSNLQTLVPGLSPSQDGRSFGVTWQSDSGLDMGMLHANGQSRSGVPCFRAGDVVGCTIDQDDAVPRLRFYLNGEQALPSAPMAAAADGTRAASRGSLAVQNPPASLFPALSMYSSKKKPQMRVRFNFRGGFRFPVAGFEPYGAPL